MDPDMVKAVIEALKAEDTAAALALLEEMLVAAASGAAPAAPADAVAAAADPTAPNAQEDPKKDEMMAAASALLKLSGRSNAGEAVEYFKSAVKRIADIDAEAASLEVAERRGLVADLVLCGAEHPSTAWVADAEGNIPEGDKRTPVARLASEPIADLRKRVGILKANRPTSGAVRLVPPPAKSPNAKPGKQYSQAEKAHMAKHNLTPEQFEERKAQRVRSA